MLSNPTHRFIYQAPQVQGLVRALAGAIGQEHHSHANLRLVGIRTGGAFLAQRLAQDLSRINGVVPPVGTLDITLYRDDWTRLHVLPKVGRTEIGFPIEESRVVLVDDVLYTGRTVRAAMDALMDFGRPASIELAVLIDRGGRELPIQPDYVGAKVSCATGQVIDVLFTEGGAAEDAVVRRVLRGANGAE